MTRKPTIVDIARALGVSTATVHRALRDSPNVTAATRRRVRDMAEQLGYKPNLAARFLSSKSSLRVSVNTMRGTTSFWDEVRAGIEEEKRLLDIKNVEINYRIHSQHIDQELDAFQSALSDEVDGIITFPSDPERIAPLMHQAHAANIPVVFVATDAPQTGRLAVVSIDTMASGSLAADLMGHLAPTRGKAGVTLFKRSITEHTEKHSAFEQTMQQFYPNIEVLDPLEDHDVEEIGYERSVEMLRSHPDTVGLYVTTELSMPVIRAARDLGMLERLTIITTDLFPSLVDEIRSGAVTATIYQRPRSQGRIAFRVLHDYLVSGERPSSRVTLAPHLVMRGNLEFFLRRSPLGTAMGKPA